MTDYYVYKVIKSFWGIRIEFQFMVYHGSHCENFICINDSLSVDLSTITKLSDRQLQFIVSAFQFIGQYISKSQDKILIISINKIDYQITDYQDEGLYCGIIQWASNKFDFKIPNFEIEFNKQQNKYVFLNIPLVEGLESAKTRG